MKTIKLEVSVEVLPSVGYRELRGYVQEAVSYWGGQRHPDDHLFSANIGKVKVKQIKDEEHA